MSEIKLVRHIAARPSIVFEALTTTEGMTSWWGPDEGPVLFATADVRVGGRFCVRFRLAGGSEHADGASEHECTGEFLEIEAPRRIVMSWQWIFGGDPGERERVSRLELHLRPTHTGTELTLIHAELRDEATARSHEWGWGGALDKLMRRLTSLADQVAR
jgi:uncharacterized protein YndB with AHSA1/START domain